MLLTIQPTSTKSFSTFTSAPGGEAVDEMSKMLEIKVQAVSSPAAVKSLLPIKAIAAPPPVMKNRTDLPGNFFTRIFSSVKAASNGTKKPQAPIAKGVYAIQTSIMEADSLKTIDTQSSTFSASTSPSANSAGNNQCIEPVWLPSTADDHNKGLPLIIRRPHHDIFNEADDRKLLQKIMGKAKKLPQSSGKYASNHIMVNAERTRKNVPPLARDRDLDRVARDHANVMASEKLVRHMDGPTSLQSKILEGKDNAVDRQRLFFARLGVNIAKGKSIEDIHKFMVATLAERNNILDKRFTTMGMGTARADNGMIYLCQVFGGDQ
jgi:uncharacterized protein YkwD